jgi:hypothetical protein
MFYHLRSIYLDGLYRFSLVLGKTDIAHQDRRQKLTVSIMMMYVDTIMMPVGEQEYPRRRKKRSTFLESRRNALSWERYSTFFLDRGVDILPTEELEDEENVQPPGVNNDGWREHYNNMKKSSEVQRCSCPDKRCLYSVDRASLYEKLKCLWNVRNLKTHNSNVRREIEEHYNRSTNVFQFHLRARPEEEGGGNGTTDVVDVDDDDNGEGGGIAVSAADGKKKKMKKERITRVCQTFFSRVLKINQSTFFMVRSSFYLIFLFVIFVCAGAYYI